VVALAEMERAAGLDHKGIIFSQQPELYGQPTLAARHWDLIWAAAQEMRKVLHDNAANLYRLA
jgi:hypothetical protein